MTLSVDSNGLISKAAPVEGLKFRNTKTGQEMLIAVNDKFPQMEDVHIEGRRTVEVSVEFFVELVGKVDWVVVDPREGQE